MSTTTPAASTYSPAGAQFGYALLWSLIPMTIALYVSEEMCARMGVVTGKGLSDLIREEFGFRPTFFVMVAAFAGGSGQCGGGIRRRRRGVRIFALSRYIAVPIAAIVVWILVVYGHLPPVEKIFLVVCAFYLSYVVSAFLAKPDWLYAAKHTVIPIDALECPLSADADGAGGHDDRALAILLHAGGFCRKARRPAAVQARAARRDRRQHHLHGRSSFFIIVCTAATLYAPRPTQHLDAGEPRRPWCRWRGAGRACFLPLAC